MKWCEEEQTNTRYECENCGPPCSNQWSASPTCSTAGDLARELLPAITDIMHELFDMGFTEDGEVGQKVNAIRHRLLYLDITNR